MPDDERSSKDVWNAVAPGWERWRAQLGAAYQPVREWLLAELDPRAGETLLELCAGPGDSGFAAAAISEQIRLIMTDFSPEMVEVAKRHGDALRRRNVTYRVMDAERIELDAGSVDGVLCTSGYMLVSDPAAALAETRRVLRSGGRLVFSVWGLPEHNPWDAIAADILVEQGHLPSPDPDAPGGFRLASERVIASLLDGAGFTSRRTARVPVRFTFRDLAEWHRWANDVDSIGAVLGRLSEREHAAFASRLADAFAPFRTVAGYQLPGLALCTVAS